MASPALLLHGLQLLNDPLVHAKAAQNIASSPALSSLLIGLGLLLPAAVVGAWHIKRHASAHSWIIFWAVSILVAISLPFSFQRRLSHGLVVPLAWLAAWPLAELWHRMQYRWAAVLAAVVLVITSLVASGYVIHGYAREAHIQESHLTYLKPDVRGGIAAIQSAPERGVTHGNIIAGLTGRTVYIGHSVETLDFAAKRNALQNFFSSTNRAKQLAFLRVHHICYVVYSPREMIYGSGFRPEEWPELTLLWSGSTMRVYQMKTCA
jgi:hypothetical protein